MENIFIDFLPPWVETGLQPAFYDKESGTVLQQTARMYAKMNELIKGINTQNSTIAEYITKFNELHDYVYDYFDNLDVQEEINNKLDEMAESGQLAQIIAQFLGLGAVYGFNTIEDLSEAGYLIKGSIAKVLGKTNPVTGDGSFYLVRERLNSDDPDGVNLVVLTETSNLVAEIIPDFNYEKLSTENQNHMMVFDTLDEAEEADIPEGRTFCTNGKASVNDGEGATYIKGASIDTIVNDVQENYYDEIYYETKFDSESHTNYYLTYIPKYDKNGDMIELYQGATANYSNKPSKYAKANYTSATFNFSLTYTVDSEWYLPTMIVNGEIVENTPWTNPESGYHYLAMFPDRTWVIYPATTPAQTMLNAGAVQATMCFGQCVTNGEVTYTEDGKRNNLQIIGVKDNGDIILLTSEFGNGSKGLTVTEGSNILIAKGCTNAYRLDGGGSASTTVKGYKININKDDDGRTERSIQYTLNAKKPTLNKNVGNAYNDAGNTAESLRMAGVINNTGINVDSDIDWNTTVIESHSARLYGKLLYITITSTARTWSGSDLIATLPSSLAPRVAWIPALSSTSGIISLNVAQSTRRITYYGGLGNVTGRIRTSFILELI